MVVGLRMMRCITGLVTAIAVGSGGVYADCGSIPYRSPLELAGDFVLESIAGATDVRFDPMDVVVYEPGQRAIILWNGEEQIMLLSTDIRTSQPVSILEVIPFPAEPTVSLGEFETFEHMQRLLIKKRCGALPRAAAWTA